MEISLVLAQKFLNDFVFEDKYYARLMKMKLKEYTYLESDFLSKINYSLFIEKNEFSEYCKYLLKSKKEEKEIPQKKIIQNFSLNLKA